MLSELGQALSGRQMLEDDGMANFFKITYMGNTGIYG